MNAVAFRFCSVFVLFCFEREGSRAGQGHDGIKIKFQIEKENAKRNTVWN